MFQHAGSIEQDRSKAIILLSLITCILEDYEETSLDVMSRDCWVTSTVGH